MAFDETLVRSRIGEFETNQALGADKVWSEPILQYFAELIGETCELSVSVEVYELDEPDDIMHKAISMGYQTYYAISHPDDKVILICRFVEGRTDEYGHVILISFSADTFEPFEDPKMMSRLRAKDTKMREDLRLNKTNLLDSYTNPENTSERVDYFGINDISL